MAEAVNASRPRILVISADKLGSELAGLSIRAYELAKVLAEHGDVTLAGQRTDTDPPLDVHSVTYVLRGPRDLRPHIAAADVVVAQPQWPTISRWLTQSDARLIFDLVTPEPFEILESLADRPAVRRFLLTVTLDRILRALQTGDQFVCAGENQRDLWLGAMLAERLISPSAYDRDPSLRSLIDTVPFGAPEGPPVHGGKGIRARFPVIGDGDEIALWSGGIWNWLDAETAIRGAVRLAERRPGLRLVFMAASSVGAARAATERAHALARELGALDKVVFFNDVWVPYEERADWLLDASCALSTHPEHLETRFAFRTRVLDCFWAGLPIVCTEGDELAGRIERDRLGATVPPGDPDAVAAALELVLNEGRASFAQRLAETHRDFAWPRVAEPLVRYVTSPGPPPRRARPRPPAQLARDTAFRGALAAVNVAGLKKIPFL